MKVYLPFEMMKAICLSMAEQIKTKHGDSVRLISISRGGNVPATIIAKALRKDLYFYSPKTDGVPPTMEGQLNIFIEDLVAKGRTLNAVRAAVPSTHAWAYAPFLVDDESSYGFDIYGMKSPHWIVFPWEEFDKMNEGDHGLFREGSDSYGK